MATSTMDETSFNCGPITNAGPLDDLFVRRRNPTQGCVSSDGVARGRHGVDLRDESFCNARGFEGTVEGGEPSAAAGTSDMRSKNDGSLGADAISREGSPTSKGSQEPRERQPSRASVASWSAMSSEDACPSNTASQPIGEARSFQSPTTSLAVPMF